MTRLLLMAAAAGLVLVGCGDDPLREEVGEDVSDTGPAFEDTVTVPTTPEGEIDPDAPTTSVAVEDVEVTPDGFPEGWPEDFPVPDDATVEQGAVTLGPGEERLVADLVVPESSAAGVLAFYEEELQPPDFEVLSSGDEPAEDVLIVQVTFRTDDYLGNVLATEEDDRVALTLQVTRPQG